MSSFLSYLLGMPISYKYKYKEFQLVTLPNDTQINLISYLADPTNGVPFLDPDTQAIDLFTVVTQKSSLPPSGYDTFLSLLAESFINEVYTITRGGDLINGNQIVSNLSQTSDILAGMSVSGVGIQVGTVVESVRTSTSIKLSLPATSTSTETLTFGTANWAINYSDITTLTTIVDFSLL